MMKKVLITGAAGFLGRHVASAFKASDYYTYGIGHGEWKESEQALFGLDYWIQSSITLQAIVELEELFDVIVHCGGSGSVGLSVTQPMQDFQRSVDSTLAVLEYIRLYNPDAYLIYPSSPAVQGIHDDTPIKESDPCHPVSPYGVHKKIAEDLCLSYKNYFNVNVLIIRFFSIYGPFLKKQLLWDASLKLVDNECAEFWGEGCETRDFVYISDAVSMILLIANIKPGVDVVNCGSGVRTLVNDLVFSLKKSLNSKSDVLFNNRGRGGDPKFYWADISIAQSLGWKPEIALNEGLDSYLDWFKGEF